MRKYDISKIEIGDYVRTKHGNIGKCTNKSIDKINITSVDGGGIDTKFVKVYAKDIRDLIERGDIIITPSGIYKVEDIRDGFIWKGLSACGKGAVKAFITREDFEKKCINLEELKPNEK